ncbi:MAG: 2OG-Fe(II) oxygenase [Nostochopsis sp.]
MSTIVKQIRNHILKNVYQISFLQNQADRNYQVALEQHLPKLPVLSIADLNLVESIKREGVVVTSLEALSIPHTDKMFLAAQKLMPEIPKNVSGEDNEYVVHASSEQIMQYPEIFMWGLEKRLLNIVENYISLPVAYHGAYFRRDLANSVERKSRLWHIDVEDRKILKVIVYLHDVDENCGPFQYIPLSLTSSVAHSLGYKHGYVQDKTLQKALSQSLWKSCTGKAGTVVFATTSQVFHRGKVPVDQDRFTIFFDYTSRQPQFPFYCKSSLPGEDLLSLAANFSEQQRQCVFWRPSV